MKRTLLLVVAWTCAASVCFAQKSVTLEDLLRAPFPENLTAAKKVPRVAWTFNQEGQRNVWVAEAPSFSARRLTAYMEDDGGAISDVNFSDDGNTIVYVRGEGKNAAGQFPNPTSNPAGAEQTVWSISSSGGEPKKVDVGGAPKIFSAHRPSRGYSTPDRKSTRLNSNHHQISYAVFFLKKK